MFILGMQSAMQKDKGILHQTSIELNASEPWAKLAHKKPHAGWIPYNPKTMRPLHPTNDIKYVKMISWNVNGLRALLKTDGCSVLQLAEKEDFDVLCLQETKMKARKFIFTLNRLMYIYNFPKIVKNKQCCLLLTPILIH